VYVPPITYKISLNTQAAGEDKGRGSGCVTSCLLVYSRACVGESECECVCISVRMIVCV